MFEDSLLESGKRFKTRRPLTTTLSFAVQSVILGVLITIPLFAPEVLPQPHLTTFLTAPPPPPPAASHPSAARVQKVAQKKVSEPVDTRLRTPTAIPKEIATVKDELPPPSTSVVGGVLGGIPGGTPGGVLGGVLGNPVSLPPAPPKMAPPPQKLRISSGVAEANLIHRVLPQYPALARQARIEGMVKLQAVISKGGTIENLRVISGHKILAQAALDAVKQWRYKPTLLNGEPYEVETEISVVFTLSGG
jgi:protein TonB